MSPEVHEIVPGPRRVTRQWNDFEVRRSLFDAAAEHDATHSGRQTAPDHLAGSFPTGRRTVDGALPCDHEVVAHRVESDQAEDERRAW